MKTQPAKLLMALLLSMGSIAFVAAPAFADDGKNKNDNSGKNDDAKFSAPASPCTTTENTSCGIKVQVTSCPSLPESKSTKDEEKDDNSHDSKDKDSKSKNDRDYNDDFHKDHVDHSRDATGNKIAICHRMGGARVNLVVANDGYASGHSKHPLDTIGRCEDFDAIKASDDSKADKDKDHKISLDDDGYRKGLTPAQVTCLGNLPGTVTLQSPTRGGARSMH
jgi:hypothetical protein